MNHLPLLLLSFILLSCHNTPKPPVNEGKTDSVASGLNVREKPEAAEEAVRGQATQILKPAFFPGSTFVLLDDSITGVETAQLKNGDKLIVTNCGLEYYTLEFRFETSRFDKDTTDLHFWSVKAAEMMQSIETGLDAPLDIKLGTKKFLEFVNGDAKNNFSNVTLGKEIDYGGEDIREFVALHSITRTNAGKIAVQINYSMGPL